MSTRPTDPGSAAPRKGAGVHLSIDEATVVLGLLDLLQPAAAGDEAVLALVDRTRDRLATAISRALSTNQEDGLRAL
jgi:hypothetical protein